MSPTEQSADRVAFTPEELIALARGDFTIFVELMSPVLHGGETLKHVPYLDYVCYELWRSGAPHRRGVIFNMPPGYMKSLLISVLYVAWRLGVNPGLRFICASYGDDVAHKFGRQTRQIMQSPLYRAIFPGTVLTKTAENFLETSQGAYATRRMSAEKSPASERTALFLTIRCSRTTPIGPRQSKSLLIGIKGSSPSACWPKAGSSW
jgi:hypothetical protein